MKRIQSKAGLLKRRVGAVHSRAQWVGLVYLLATIAIAVAVVMFPMLSGTPFSVEGKLPVVATYEALKALFDVGFGTIFKTPAMIVLLLALLLYFVLLLVVVINVIRALTKLNWLYKKRASYVNGFNRNM